jgi:hypothetical protein
VNVPSREEDALQGLHVAQCRVRVLHRLAELSVIQLGKLGPLVQFRGGGVLRGELELVLGLLHGTEFCIYGPEARGVPVQTPLVRVEEDVFVKVEVVRAEDVGVFDIVCEAAEDLGEGLPFLFRLTLGDAVDFRGFWWNFVELRADDVVFGAGMGAPFVDGPADADEIGPVGPVGEGRDLVISWQACSLDVYKNDFHVSMGDTRRRFRCRDVVMDTSLDCSKCCSHEWSRWRVPVVW